MKNHALIQNELCLYLNVMWVFPVTYEKTKLNIVHLICSLTMCNSGHACIFFGNSTSVISTAPQIMCYA